jgi:hypothetical protein
MMSGGTGFSPGTKPGTLKGAAGAKGEPMI